MSENCAPLPGPPTVRLFCPNGSRLVVTLTISSSSRYGRTLRSNSDRIQRRNLGRRQGAVPVGRLVRRSVNLSASRIGIRPDVERKGRGEGAGGGKGSRAGGGGD